MHHSIVALVVLLAFTGAAPTGTTAATPIPSNRVTIFPVCGIPGFTEEPGDNDLGVYPPPPISKADCIKACRDNSTCKAVSYAEVYNLCSFYARFMKFDQLDFDSTSNFQHFDEVCAV